MASTISASAVAQEFGEFYLSNRANLSQLKGELRVKPMSAKHAVPLTTDSTRQELVLDSMSEVVQAYQQTWTSKGNHTFLPKVIHLFNLKIDWEGNPDVFKALWLGFLAGLPEQDRKKWPYVRFVMERLIKQSHHDRETKSYGAGVYSAPAQGNAGSALNAMDGVRKLGMNAVANGGKLVALNNDIFSQATAFEAAEEFMDDLPEEFHGMHVKMLVPPNVAKYYGRDKRNTLGANVDYKQSNVLDFSDMYGEGTGIEVVPFRCFNGLNTVLATPAENFIHVTHATGVPVPTVEVEKRTLAIYTDWYEGFGFIDDKQVYMHDPDHSDSASVSAI